MASNQSQVKIAVRWWKLILIHSKEVLVPLAKTNEKINQLNRSVKEKIDKKEIASCLEGPVCTSQVVKID